MKIIKIDNYEICEENGRFTAATFKDYDEKIHQIKLTNELENYFRNVRKEEFKNEYRNRRYIDAKINKLDENMILKMSILKDYRSAEDIYVERNLYKTIITEIKKLPTKQSSRVFLKLIYEFSISEISKIEGVAHSTVSESTNDGIDKIAIKIKKIKKF